MMMEWKSLDSGTQIKAYLFAISAYSTQKTVLFPCVLQEPYLELLKMELLFWLLAESHFYNNQFSVGSWYSVQCF